MLFHIRKVHNHVYDCFIGNGFDNWVRVRRNHWGVSVLAGMRLKRGTLKALHERLTQFN